jgi:hypothetical protein
MPLALLSVEDSSDDVELIRRQLRQHGFRPEVRQVQTRAENGRIWSRSWPRRSRSATSSWFWRRTSCARVEVRLERLGTLAQIWVSDRGIGIAPQDQARIFGRFERAGPVRNYGGLGLGLWIARAIVEAHAGSLTVASELGKGAIFMVNLPLAPS